MNQMSGSVGTGPLFRKIAKLVVYRGAVPQIPSRPEPPAGIEQIEVCPLSGMTPTAHCPHQRSVYILAEDQPHPPAINIANYVSNRIEMSGGGMRSDPIEFEVR